MVLVKPKKRIGSKPKKPLTDDGSLFEKFALSVWLWKKIDGQIVEWDCAYMTQKQIKERFKTWKSKK